MFRSLKSLIMCSCLFASLFVVADFSKAEAATGRWGAYDRSWGGNGGWWGGGNSDWYGEGTPYDYDNYYGGNYHSAPYYSDGYDNNYYFDNSYPYGQHYYGDHDFGIGAGAGVGPVGAGAYFNVR